MDKLTRLLPIEYASHKADATPDEGGWEKNTDSPSEAE